MIEVDPVLSALEPLGERAPVRLQDLAARAHAAPGIVHAVGARGSAPALLAYTLLASYGRSVVYVAPSHDAATRAHADLTALVQGLPLPAPYGRHEPALPLPWLLLSSESSPYAVVHPDRRLVMQRAATLYSLAADPWSVLVCTVSALMRRVAPKAELVASARRLEVGCSVDIYELGRALDRIGYLRVPVVEDAGSFAVRGGLFDVWSPNSAEPVRAELEGDTLVRLRTFDPLDQRTGAELQAISLAPAREAILSPTNSERARHVLRSLCDAVDYPSTRARRLVDDVAEGKSFFGAEAYLPAFFQLEPLFSYLEPGTAFVIEEPDAFVSEMVREQERARLEQARREEQPSFELGALYLSEPELQGALQNRPIIASTASSIVGPREGLFSELVGAPVTTPSLAIHDHADLSHAVRSARLGRGNLDALTPLVLRITAWQSAGLNVIISARSERQLDRLATLLNHREIPIVRRRHGERRSTIRDRKVELVISPLSRGVLIPTEAMALVTEEEIFGQRAHRPASRKRSVRAVLEDLRALTTGDYVVHVNHGIGRYRGLEHKRIGAMILDLIVVEYLGGDKLFLPVYRLNQIQKYSGADATPRLDRLGGISFAKTKSKVRRRVRQLADELLKLYAERTALKKRAIPKPDDEYAAFEATFPYEETRDQATAIAEVLGDLGQERVMDRLVCGDVGFGKTEVAIRAAFLNAMAGHQVALLCPTTVLAQQHYLTFASRFSDYAIEVRVLSRFQSKLEQQDTLRGLRTGTVDVVIGTHRLLSRDVHFKNLGLLVVDEEQRFGVSHKERIKQLRTSVDVLTLSATPIPRTLQMAVGGLRDLSIITTPPLDRRAIRTIASRFDEALVRQAIDQELSRGGQIFYVYNRIEGLHERAERVRSIVPHARVAVAHGQLQERTLEKTMLRFVRGDYDVLCTTAIIESGLDIPRANTIIIDRADLFGLSQLYQLRGRVGRSSERAYCYLLVPAEEQLSDEARARLETLERYTELGSGLHVASLDMELRGTGDLLGTEQSGFVASVGFELFCQMLEETSHELRGEPVVHEVDPDLNFDVDALLPEDYVAEVGVRLSLYKRLAGATDEADIDDIASEIEDRFGSLPKEARRLVELMRVKTELRRLRVLGCDASSRSVSLHLRDDTPLDPLELSRFVGLPGSAYRLSPEGRLSRRARDGEGFPNGLEHVDLVLQELAHLVRVTT